MRTVVRASWEQFERIAGSASEVLTVCTPYFTREGLGRLFDHLQAGTALTFVTRLSPTDWLNNVSDPVELRAMLDMLEEDGRAIQLLIHQRLHAKAYLADNSIGLIGSANLSTGGFQSNFELMVYLAGDEVVGVKRIIQEEVDRNALQISLDALGSWVESHERRISEYRAGSANVATDLAEVQRGLDTMLGHGKQQPRRTPAIPYDMEDFVKWMEARQTLAGVNVLLERHHNTNGQNLTGHFRQSFYGAANFLADFPQYVVPISDQLSDMTDNEVFQPDDLLLNDWIQHLDTHATYSGPVFDYAVLRGILPPSLGGTRLGGGGGSSTLKRMLPLVSQYIRDVEGEY